MTTLTPDETTIANGLAHNRPLHRIAADLDVAPATINSRINRTVSRLDLTGHPRPRLVDYAYRSGHLTETAFTSTGLPDEQALLLDAFARGLTLAQAAEEQSHGYHVAHTHYKRLYERLGAHTKWHAVGLGWRHGLLGPPEQT
jgi:DNA-binding NarL/FixJ family response regulator